MLDMTQQFISSRRNTDFVDIMHQEHVVVNLFHPLYDERVEKYDKTPTETIIPHTKEMLCEADRCISHVSQDKVQHWIVPRGLYHSPH